MDVETYKRMREKIREVFKDRELIHIYRRPWRNQILVSAHGNVSDNQLITLSSIAKSERTSIVIGAKKEVIFIDDRGVVNREEIDDAQSFIKHMIITAGLRERFTREEKA